MFITKPFLSIVASMINQMRGTQTKITDFRIGAVSRTVVEAGAIEIDELYQQYLDGLTDAIPVAIYLAFGFGLLPAATANGAVVYTIPIQGTNALIPLGSQVTSTDGTKQYLTLANLTILAGQTTGAVDVRATQAGSIDNCGLGEISVITNGAPVGATVTNPVAFTNGADPEMDTGRQIRFNRFIQSLSRGPLASIEYGATTSQLLDSNGVITEQVVAASAIELYQIRPTSPLGYVTVYVFNGGSGASGTLVAKAQQIVNGYLSGPTNVPGYKSAGVRATVLAVTLQTLNLTGNVVTNNGLLTSAQVTALNTAFNAVIAAVGIGNTLYTDALSTAAKTVTGVISFTPTSPANNYNPGPGIKLQPGTITLTPVIQS